MTASGLFALLFMLNQIIQTIRRQTRIGFVHTLLAFLVVLVALAALITNTTSSQEQPIVQLAAPGIAGVVIIVGLIVTLLELRRPERLKQSRGVLSMGVGVLLLIASFSVPFTAAYIQLSTQPSPTPTAGVVAAAPTSAASPPTQSGADMARDVFRAVLKVISDQTGLDADTIVKRLDAGDTIAQIVKEKGGNLDVVVKGVSDAMSAQVRQLSAAKRMNPIEAALALSQMETIVRLGVNRNLKDSRLGDFLKSGAESTAEAIAAAPTAIAAATTVTDTPQPTFTPTSTRTPRPTDSATATRFTFVTSTPLPTATVPDPCLALTKFNVNLRAKADPKADVVATIPFNSSVALFGRSEDSVWWYARYADQTGWLKGEFLTLTAQCDKLPVKTDG
jgi:hypothetical protein